MKHKQLTSAQYKQHNFNNNAINCPPVDVLQIETHELKHVHVHKQAEFYVMLQVQYPMAVTIF